MLTNLNVEEDSKQELSQDQRLQLSSLGRHSDSDKDGSNENEEKETVKIDNGLISDDDEDDANDLAAKIAPIIMEYGSYSIKTGLSYGNNIHGPKSIVRTIMAHKKPSLQQRISKKLSKTNFDFSGISSFFNKAKSRVDGTNDTDDVIDEPVATDEIVYNATTNNSGNNNSNNSKNNGNKSDNGNNGTSQSSSLASIVNKNDNSKESKTNNNNSNLHKESSSKLLEMKTTESYLFGDSVISKLPDPRMSTFDEIMDSKSLLHFGHIKNFEHMELMYDFIFGNEINIGNYNNDSLCDHPQFHLQSITTLNDYQTLLKLCDIQPDIKVHGKGKIVHSGSDASMGSNDILVSQPASSSSSSQPGSPKRRKSKRKSKSKKNESLENSTVRQACGIGEPSGQTHRICEILFEKYGIPAFYTMYSQICSLYGSGISSGIIVDIGYDSTRISGICNNNLPGYNEYTMRNHNTYMPYEFLDVGGESMTQHLMSRINIQTQSNYLKALSPNQNGSTNIHKTYDFYTFERLKLLGLKSFKFDYTSNNNKKPHSKNRRSILKFNNNNNGNGNGNSNNVHSKTPVFYIAYDYHEELKRAFSPRSQYNNGTMSPSSGVSNNFGKLSKFTLPDGKTIVCDLKKESFEMGEVLFQPFMAKSSQSSIIDKIINVAQMLYCDDNKTNVLSNGFNLYDHIVLTGAGSMIDGLIERIERDLKLKQQRQLAMDQKSGFLSKQNDNSQHTPPLSDSRLLPSQSNVTITAKPHRKNCAWLGASAYIEAVLGSADSGKWFDKNMYQEFGAKGVYRVCSL